MSKHQMLGSGIGNGHGGNTANLPVLREVPMNPNSLALRGLEPGVRHFKGGKLSVLVARHPVTQAWHISIAHPDRYPTWDEIAYARYELIPDDVFMVMALPSKKDYVNFHNYCFQLHEIPGDVWNG